MDLVPFYVGGLGVSAIDIVILVTALLSLVFAIEDVRICTYVADLLYAGEMAFFYEIYKASNNIYLIDWWKCAIAFLVAITITIILDLLISHGKAKSYGLI